MSRTALWAPAHIVDQRYPSGNTGGNPDRAPSVIFGGPGIQDHRLPYNKLNSSNGAGVLGWHGPMPLVVEAVPSTLTTTAIAAAQVPVAGTAMTLVAATGAGITVLASSFLALPSLTTIAANTLAIDGAPGYLRFGLNFFTAFHDPTKALARNIQIASVGNDSGATFLVSGYDLYGYPMSERITGANAGTAVGAKAFKFVASIVPAGALSGSNASAGQGDVYGLPIRGDRFGQVAVYWNAALVTAQTGFVAADTTSPATTTTGDPRGTYAVQSASNNTKRLEIRITPIVTALQSNPTTGLFGVTPV